MDPSSPSSSRIASVDIVRGLIMAFMVVDHVRYPFFTNIPIWPEDTQNTTLALFLTRWITHFCAPLFFFLAGTSTFLSRHFKQTSIQGTSAHLWKRGLWLVVLELTVIDFSWGFMPGWMFGGVIWSLGLCMIILAVVIRLPMGVLTWTAFGVVVGHEFLASISADSFGPLSWLWNIVYGGGVVPTPWLPAGRFPVLYVLVPHLAVMMLGYALGRQLVKDVRYRSRFLLTWGSGLTALFIILRATNLFGNPSWGDFAGQETLARSIVSFLNTSKYPFSFQFLLMTIGPGMILMGVLEKNSEISEGGMRIAEWLKPISEFGLRIAKWLSVFGRVPFFFYLIHIPLIHILAILVGSVLNWSTDWLFGAALPLQRKAPPEFGFRLAGTWAITVGVVVLLYFPCRWFAGVKARRKNWWVRYL